ncbi:hypothetical protein L1987_27325 [Smallanthus sonchifolius]|uniref:Uncharacterized protein n=1 Tax=Smallanthus sonchifolius TaxID=185202 RepID=A0ACB9ICH0_9ASTR|nr:hypothetical protein L1987_27325 [Smallanthus sonchifolius]
MQILKNSNPSGSDATKDGKSNIKEDIEEDDDDGENEENENLDYDESKIYIEGESTEVFSTSSSSSDAGMDDDNEAQSVDNSRALIVYQSYFVNEVAANVGYVAAIVVDVANSDVLNEDAHTTVPYVLRDQNTSVTMSTSSASSSERKCIARCLVISGYEYIVVAESDAVETVVVNTDIFVNVDVDGDALHEAKLIVDVTMHFQTNASPQADLEDDV